MIWNNIEIKEETIITFSDLSWNDSVNTSRSTGGHIIFIQGGEVDNEYQLPVLLAMYIGEAEYISVAVA